LANPGSKSDDIAAMGILVVDDLPGNRVLLQHILEATGFQNVLLAESADQAFGVLGMNGAKTEPGVVDLVLMDVMMPGMDGIEACRRIKASPDLCDTPIMMVTALSEVESLEDAFAAGAVDYITKPINQVELHARVRSVLALKQAMDERRHRERELERREKELLEVTRLLEETNERLRHLSTLDGLTGISNRRRVMEYMEQEWRRSARDRTWLSVLMIDVDFFKNYNDSCGHQAGDDCLWMVANCLKRNLNRPADMVGRYGGEEFIAVLPETPLDGAVNVADMARESIVSLNIPHPDSAVDPRVTITIGVASCMPGGDSTISDLITGADRALYEGKAAGRNRVAAGQATAAPGKPSEEGEAMVPDAQAAPDHD
jgi:diguanylate cyclase (GGDEF)-like protein|tara:strand:- start:454 stop:1572 length:1119 start_codon:yes stop_codon:yes gene_type:complete